MSSGSAGSKVGNRPSEKYDSMSVWEYYFLNNFKPKFVFKFGKGGPFIF